MIIAYPQKSPLDKGKVRTQIALRLVTVFVTLIADTGDGEISGFPDETIRKGDFRHRNGMQAESASAFATMKMEMHIRILLLMKGIAKLKF